jgi:Txe/YoeB family toxin of toxin-antitoxin system
MKNYTLKITKAAKKDLQKINESPLKKTVTELLKLIADKPYQNPPPYEKLQGNFKGAYSRRINIQHRLIYQVLEASKEIKIISMWTHYE